jgi:hypothetical protein
MAIEPTIKVSVDFISCRTGQPVVRELVLTKSEINDVAWFGGNSGNLFFDNEFENNYLRFERRIEDCIHRVMWEEDEFGNTFDLDLDGDYPGCLDYDDRLSFDYELGDGIIEDFFPD